VSCVPARVVKVAQSSISGVYPAKSVIMWLRRTVSRSAVDRLWQSPSLSKASLLGVKKVTFLEFAIVSVRFVRARRFDRVVSPVWSMVCFADTGMVKNLELCKSVPEGAVLQTLKRLTFRPDE
jgi:hypothetical protein